MKRYMLALFVIAIMVFISVNSFSAPVIPPASEAKINWQRFAGTTLNIMLCRHPWQETIEPYFPEFEQLTGIKVVPTILPEVEYLTKVPADLTAGTFAFDVFMTQYYDAPMYDREKWTEPLGKYILDPELTDLDWYDWTDFYLPAQKMLTIGGTAGDRIAITAEVEALIYRKDMISEAGVTIPDTFDDLLITAGKINAALKDRYGVVLRGNPENWWPLYGIIKSYGADYFTADYKPVINSPEAIAAVKMWSELQKFAPPGITNFNWEQVVTSTASGLTAIFLDSSGLYTTLFLRGLEKEKAGIAPFPKGPGGRIPHAHMWSISISAASKQKAAAWLFIEWATSKDIQYKQALANMLPPRKSVLESPDIIVKNPELVFATSKGLFDGVLSRPHLKFFDLMNPFARGLQEILLGQKDVETALNETQKTWEEMLK